jgi:cobalt/nickel transport system permease protein
MSDALLSGGVGVAMLAVSATALGYSASKLSKSRFDEKLLPMLGVMGAFVFAAQMVNFSIPMTGSSGHIGGGVLLAAVLGPYAAMIAIASVLLIQCLLFADGGLLALGCNIFNMGIIPCFIAYPLIYRTIMKRGVNSVNISIASIAAVVVGLQFGALGVVVETTLSRITVLPFASFLLLMQPIHLAIGVIEGLITAAVIAFIYKLQPAILESSLNNVRLNVTPKNAVVIMLVFALLVGSGLSLAASGNPDGLEWSMENVAGTAELEADSAIHNGAALIQEKTALLPDYSFKSDGSDVLGTAWSGFFGGAVTLVLAIAVGFAVTMLKRKTTS